MLLVLYCAASARVRRSVLDDDLLLVLIINDDFCCNPLHAKVVPRFLEQRRLRLVVLLDHGGLDENFASLASEQAAVSPR